MKFNLENIRKMAPNYSFISYNKIKIQNTLVLSHFWILTSIILQQKKKLCMMLTLTQKSPITSPI